MPRQPKLRVFLFGLFRLEREGKPVPLPTRKVEALLAYLILHPEPQLREKLAALFWGESPAVRANGSLRTALNVLRQRLGKSAILGDRYNTVQFNPDFPIRVDVRDFERAAAGEADPGLLDLYRGDLLAEHYDDWLTPLREHYRERQLAGLLQLTQLRRAQSEYGRAIEFAHQVLTLDSGNERAHQHLMFCYLATGNREAALAQYDRCRQILRQELSVEPLPETMALYQWIKQAALPRPSTAALKTNLPIPFSSFVGRRRETAQLKQLLAPRPDREGRRIVNRLVTLTGPGGCGKTRLAIQVATDLIDAYEAGVWWVELVQLTEAALVPQAVAQALGVSVSPTRATLELLVEHLRSKRLLLVLDNCEHLITACARLVDRLLTACPHLQILVTSREALALTGEVIWPTPSLSLPDPRQLDSLETLGLAESVQLFVERAAAVRPGFQLTPQNALALAQVCERLDGIPLAIELAAARVKVLSVEQIRARLDDQFGLLTTGSRTALPRHQTLRAALDWSYELLPAAEQTLLRFLAVFAGGFSLEAVEAVCGSIGVLESVLKRSPTASLSEAPFRARLETPARMRALSEFEDTFLEPALPVLNLLTQLVNKSLVVVEPAEGEATRYRLLEIIRQYALARLAEAGEDRLIHEQHLAYFSSLAEILDSKTVGADQNQALDQLEMEHGNLRAALDFGETEPGQVEAALRVAAALRRFWLVRGHYQEGRERLDRLLARPEAAAPTAARAKALHGLGGLCHQQGDYAAARPYLQAGQALYRELGDRYGIAATLNNLGLVAHEQGDNEQAKILLKESVDLFRQVGDKTGLGNALNNLGHVNLETGDFPEARLYIEASVPVYREGGNHQALAYALHNLGELARQQGNLMEARAYHDQALAIRRRLDDRPRVAWSLSALGLVAYELGDEPAAAVALEESVQLFRQVGERLGLATALGRLGRVRLYLEELSSAATELAEALRLFVDLNRQKEVGETLAGLGAVAAAEGQAERAARLLAAAGAMLTTLDAQGSPADKLLHEQAISLARSQLKPAIFELAWAAGQAMAAGQGEAAVNYALDLYS